VDEQPSETPPGCYGSQPKKKKYVFQAIAQNEPKISPERGHHEKASAPKLNGAPQPGSAVKTMSRMVAR
jgi:hypothetical protein